MNRLLPLTLLALVSCATDSLTSDAPSLGSARIHVLLRSASAAPTNRIRVPGPYRLTEAETGDLVESGSLLDRALPTSGASLPGALRLIPGGGRFLVNDRRYDGTLLLAPGETGIQLIVETDLESYLPGVLARELSASFPAASLRAQAVASRTYALHRREEAPPGRAWHVADDQSDQVFGGVPDPEEGPLQDAARATRGMVLMWRSKPLPAHFHSTCGGATACRHEVFGGAEIPPLTSVPCDYCRISRYYRWETRIPLAEVASRLGLPGGLRGAEVLRTDSAGRALTLRLDGSSTVERSAADVRMSLGPERLRSTRILRIRTEGAHLVISGAGWGHGVGMCQMGAKGMALAGASAGDILAHYYPGAHLFRLYGGIETMGADR